MKTTEINSAISFSGNFTQQAVAGRTTWFEQMALGFEESRFFWMTMIITVQSCLGSIACMFILQNDTGIMALAGCAAVTMSCNAVLIAQSPARWCLAFFGLSVLLNLGFLVFSI